MKFAATSGERHKTFGGLIYESDFVTDYCGKNNYSGSRIASRIWADWRFDEECRKNIIGRDEVNV